MCRLTFVTLFSVCLSISGCDSCRNDECPEGVPFLFKVADQDGNILSGYSPYPEPYNSDSVQLWGRSEDGDWLRLQVGRNLAVLSFFPQPTIREYQLRYAFAGPDTLFFDTNTYADDCCPELVTGYSLQINQQIQPAPRYDSVYVFVK